MVAELQLPAAGGMEALAQLLERCMAREHHALQPLVSLLQQAPTSTQPQHREALRRGVTLLRERAFSHDGQWQLPISKKAFRRLVREVLGDDPSLTPATENPPTPEDAAARLHAGLIRWLEADGKQPLAAQEADQAVTHVLARMASGAAVRAVFFVCPPVDYRRLNSDAESFVLTDVETALVRRHRRRVQELLQLLIEAGVCVELTALVGDTDERDYLWLRSGPPIALCPQRLAQRRAEFRAGLLAYLNDRLAGKWPGRVTVKVENLSALMEGPDPGRPAAVPVDELAAQFTEGDIQKEVDFMRTLWEGPEPYYEGLPQPSEPRLREIVRDKFIAYAMQGRMLLAFEPMLLIQTERPPALRIKMLNAARNREGQPLLQALQYYPQ